MRKIFFSKTDVLQHWGAYPGQTGLTIIDIDMTGRTAASATGVYDLLRPKLVVRKLVVGYLHDPRCVERFGEYKQEGFKTNLVIIKSRMEESNDMTDIQYHP